MSKVPQQHSLLGSLKLLEVLEAEDITQTEVNEKVQTLKNVSKGAAKETSNKSNVSESKIPGLSADSARQLKKRKEQQENIHSLEEYIKCCRQEPKESGTKLSL
ncbi:unnamed protein product [Cladocopium goreaui]|uniref:Uncharacterized protein n=1 Tax=Cladocopium goreaui TaxID=2562237 RepID=A0A9P1DG48_9DINO|nr:unnamed protein product [Cladocopium goreaui]|mmetsp:Transcript_878/g.2016  ORF Transcript_878/g.2016 Transcript_878/m.2016 type:complete len:104 (-) Transcript_878:99-410(-)